MVRFHFHIDYLSSFHHIVLAEPIERSISISH